jgi:hypothetical protein
MREFPLERLLERLAPGQQLAALLRPKFLWSVDRLRVKLLISGITPKVCLALKLGRRPENPMFSGY